MGVCLFTFAYVEALSVDYLLRLNGRRATPPIYYVAPRVLLALGLLGHTKRAVNTILSTAHISGSVDGTHMLCWVAGATGRRQARMRSHSENLIQFKSSVVLGREQSPNTWWRKKKKTASYSYA